MAGRACRPGIAAREWSGGDCRAGIAGGCRVQTFDDDRTVAFTFGRWACRSDSGCQDRTVAVTNGRWPLASGVRGVHLGPFLSRQATSRCRDLFRDRKQFRDASLVADADCRRAIRCVCVLSDLEACYPAHAGVVRNATVLRGIRGCCPAGEDTLRHTRVSWGRRRHGRAYAGRYETEVDSIGPTRLKTRCMSRRFDDS